MKDLARQYILWLLLIVLGSIVGSAWWYEHQHQYDGLLQFIVLDVGQGIGIYIRTPHNREILIDTGPSMQTLRHLERYRSVFDRELDEIIISHGDYDHMAMLPHLLETYQVNQLWSANEQPSNGLHRTVKTLMEEGTSKWIIPKQGMVRVLDADVYMEILWPDDVDVDTSRNNQSVVIRIIHGKNSFLIPGDIEKETEGVLVRQYGSALKSDVLVVAHHGSKTSSTKSFIRNVAPELAIISVGENNRYGHPHINTLDTLEQYGINVLRTDMAHNIRLISDGQQILIE